MKTTAMTKSTKELQSLRNRLQTIAKETKDLEKFFSESERSLKSHFEDTDSKISKIFLEANSIKDSLKQINKQLSEVVFLVKNSATQEDLKAVEELMKDFNPEFWVTMEQAIKEIKD